MTRVLGSPLASRQTTAHAAAAASESATRDRRVDLFRGVALLWILTNHITLSGSRPAPAIFRVLPPYWGYTSGLEVFVFLSGLVFGIVHLRAQQERGLFFSQMKAVHRAIRLYIMNAFTMVMVIALASMFITRDVTLEQVRLLPPFLTQPKQAFAGILWLNFGGFLFRILPLYIKLLLVMPVLVWLMRRNALAALALSLLVYTIAQLRGTGAGVADGAFDPFAYQFLFALGTFTALGGMRPLARHRRTLLWLAAAMLIVTAAGRLVFPTLVNAGLAKASWDCLPAVLTGRGNLGPLRIVHFLAFAYLVSSWTRRESPFWQGRLARPLVVCGQYSLEVFCFGMVLTYLTMFLLQRTAESYRLVLVVLVLASYAASIAFASYLEWRRRFLREDRGGAEV